MIPVIAISGRRDAILDAALEREGVLGILSKPFDDEELLALIGNAIERIEPALTKELPRFGAVFSLYCGAGPWLTRTRSPGRIHFWNAFWTSPASRLT